MRAFKKLLCDLFNSGSKTGTIAALRKEQSEMDFVLIHPFLGIYLIEVKSTASDAVKALEQLKKSQKIIALIAKTICPSLDPSHFIRGSACVLDDQFIEADNDGQLSNSAIKLTNRDQLEYHFATKALNFTKTDFFHDEQFRKLIAIFVGSRPDIFISPIKCVMHWNKLIDSQEVRQILKKTDYVKRKQLATTSLDNHALTATEILQKLKNKEGYSHLKVHIRFAGGEDANGERVIYFTEKQQAAVLEESEKLIITGVPGSGKSFILMMRIFIAAQDASRQDILISTIAAPTHRENYYEFIEANKESFCRRLMNTPATAADNMPAPLDQKEASDCFCDEVYPGQIPAYSSWLKHRATLILSSAYRNQHNVDSEIRQFKYTIFNLETHFRGTKHIAKFWQKYYLRNERESLTVGHNFDGIPPEIYRHYHIDDCILAMKSRIKKLTEDEGCNIKNFAISFESLAEMHAIGENLNANYEFRLNKGTLPQILHNSSTLIESLMEDWLKGFFRCFKTAVTSNMERHESLRDFNALSFILLEVQTWNCCDEPIKNKIHQSFDFFILQLNQLSVDKSRRQQWQWGDDESVEIIAGTIIILNLVKKLLESASFNCLEINWIELELPIISVYVGQILKQKLNESIKYSEYAKIIEYFQEFRVIKTWPKMLVLQDLPSTQFPIQILFVAQTAKDYEGGMNPSRYNDFLSVASSRAQSHLIVFAFCEDERNNEQDQAFIAMISATRDL